MAIRNIYLDGDPILRKKCRPVVKFDEKLSQILDDMNETLDKAGGVGLAAPQVGVLKQVVVIDISPEQDDPHVFINPVITESTGEQEGYEGCLSVPGKSGWVKRPMYVKATALNENMERFEIEGTELFARAMCHEFDHLKGELYVRLAEDGLIDNEELMAAEEEE
jgi:peptide deformylase